MLNNALEQVASHLDGDIEIKDSLCSLASSASLGRTVA
jgi:hypothetical protein